ncbi:gamma-glutamylcyclotransferase family protein [Marinobacterium lutimaris]|uniref:AIG2-like family protein n=1 Tax=Marinobacterium lutimaris TaxID=568106 RepID=A0A1H6AMK5_9GAMM|nr:gamma-glutamylcyclotransferase family protein [Marinobacterium lutimaris]SEG49959.1 AIG2-like family protein [Marinobacterium lutimaris]
MFRYFGFGSNMNITSLRAKGVEPLASRRAVLHGWRLRFNVQHFFRHEGGVGNIEPSDNPDDCVWGVLHDCPDEALAPLDATEAYGHGYDRVEVEVEVDGDDEQRETVKAIVYVGLPDFINDECRPSQRYLNILARGAEDEGLASEYVRYIQEHPVHEPEDYPLYQPPVGDYPEFDARSLAAHPLYTALYGAVFDMSGARAQHEYLKGFFGGRDMTLFHLKRLDCSDGSETLEDIRLGQLNASQMHYLNAYLNEYDREYRYVGRFIYRQEEQV